jgi:hypothetical protein
MEMEIMIDDGEGCFLLSAFATDFQLSADN